MSSRGLVSVIGMKYRYGLNLIGGLSYHVILVNRITWIATKFC